LTVRIRTSVSAAGKVADSAQTAPAAQLQPEGTFDAGQPYKVMKAAAANSRSLTVATISDKQIASTVSKDHCSQLLKRSRAQQSSI
jgi:hypothetical protein